MEKLLTTEDLANYLALDQSTVNHWRLAGSGPDFIRFANNTVRYRPAAVEAWLDQRVNGPAKNSRTRHLAVAKA